MTKEQRKEIFVYAEPSEMQQIYEQQKGCRLLYTQIV